MPDPQNDLLSTVRDFHVQGQLDRAEPLYREIIEADPENAEAWHLLGVLMLQKGQGVDAESYLSEAIKLKPDEAKYFNNLSSAQKLGGKVTEAEGSLRKAVELDPNFADGHVNLGYLLSEAERYDEAIVSYRSAIEHYPKIAELHQNLAHALFQVGLLDEAKLICLKALSLKPDLSTAQNVLGGILAGLNELPEAIDAYEKALSAGAVTISSYNNLGLIYRTQRNFEAAESNYRRALSLEPENVDSLVGLASVLMASGQEHKAIETFQQILAIDPENGDAKHMISALSGRTTDTAPEAYVKSLFDFYAPNFDQDLTERLQYKIPFQMREVVDQYFADQEPGVTPEFKCLLDQGSGTGLVGEAFQNCTDVMIGLDLAPKMIAAASEKEFYDELHEIELGDYLAGPLSADRSFDIVAAADVFIYIGKLDNLFEATVKRLQSGALYVFSVENSNSEDFILRSSGRYAQSRAYIERLASTHGFSIEVAEPAKIRKHGNKFMQGTIYILKYL